MECINHIQYSRNKYNLSSRSTKKSNTTWKAISQLLQRDNTALELPAEFSDGETYFNNLPAIAEKCNNYFVNIGQTLANKIPPCGVRPLDFIPRSHPIMSLFKLTDMQEIALSLMN